MTDKEALKGAIGAEYQKSPWDGKGTSMPPPEATVQEPVAYRQTGWAAHRDHYAVPVLFNPYTGDPRDVRDVQSDPQGILIVPPGKVEMLAAKPTHQQGLQVAAPPAAPDLQAELDATNRQVEILSDALAKSRRQRQWVGLTLADREKLRDQFEGWNYPAILVDAISDILKEKNT
jgi:hypothetical protein